MRSRLFYLFFSAWMMCGCNVYSWFQSGDSHEEILQRALDALNAGEWDTAIAYITALYEIDPTATNVREFFASAHAGKGGFNFFTSALKYLGPLGDATSGTPFFRTLITENDVIDLATAAMKTSVDTAFDALRAEDANATGRTRDTNMFLAYLALYRAHIIGKLVADADNDEAIDAGWTDACDAGDLPNANANQMMSSLVTFVKSISQTTSGSQPPISLVTLIDTAWTTVLDPALEALSAGGGDVWSETTAVCGVNAVKCRALRGVLASKEDLDAGGVVPNPFYAATINLGMDAATVGSCP